MNWFNPLKRCRNVVLVSHVEQRKRYLICSCVYEIYGLVLGYIYRVELANVEEFYRTPASTFHGAVMLS